MESKRSNLWCLLKKWRAKSHRSLKRCASMPTSSRKCWPSTSTHREMCFKRCSIHMKASTSQETGHPIPLQSKENLNLTSEKVAKNKTIITQIKRRRKNMNLYICIMHSSYHLRLIEFWSLSKPVSLISVTLEMRVCNQIRCLTSFSQTKYNHMASKEKSRDWSTS